MAEEAENIEENQPDAESTPPAKVPAEEPDAVDAATITEESTEVAKKKPADENVDITKILTEGVEDEDEVTERQRTNFQDFSFQKRFEFQDFNNIYVVQFEDGSTEEVTEESVHNIVEKFKDKEIKSITAKSATVTSIFEGSVLQSQKEGDNESTKGDGEAKEEKSEE